MADVKILPDDALNIIRQKAYRVVCYVRIDPTDDVELTTLAEARAEADQAERMQPENKYVVERVNE